MKKVLCMSAVLSGILLAPCAVQAAPADALVYSVPAYNGFKSFERGIRENGSILFRHGTKQYSLQAMAETEDGFRKINGRYLVAVGSRFTDDIGQYITLVLDSGAAIPCIVGDQKADCDTDATNTFSRNSCCSEFIVDIRTLDGGIKERGDVSYYRKEWDSPVSSIIVYDINLFNDSPGDPDEIVEKLAKEYINKNESRSVRNPEPVKKFEIKKKDKIIVVSG